MNDTVVLMKEGKTFRFQRILEEVGSEITKLQWVKIHEAYLETAPVAIAWKKFQQLQKATEEFERALQPVE